MARKSQVEQMMLTVLLGVLCVGSVISGVTGAALNSPEAKAAIKVK